MTLKLFLSCLVVCLLVVLVGGLAQVLSPGSALIAQASPASVSSAAYNTRAEAIIIDHTAVDIAAVPQNWVEEAKRTLRIAYGHTSHGSQLPSGMSGLISFANSGGLSLTLPQDIFQFSSSGNDGGEMLHLFEGDGYGDGDLDHDCGYFPNWLNETRAYLGAPDLVTGRGTSHPEMNVIIWSWCGQASGYSEQMMLDAYLLPMTQLEIDYPGVVFVYMTGHSDGTGEAGNLHARNQQIRAYALANNKVLFDFYDIELYDPDGNYYGDKLVNDNCDYDSDGNGSRDRNWALDWQSSHTQGADWYSVSCAHSQSVNCNQKAYAAWWLWARLAGWDGASQTGSALDLHGSPADASIHLDWILSASLPLTSTWQIDYQGTPGDQASPISGLDAATTEYTLTGVENYTWYTITLSAWLDGSSILSDTLLAMPTDQFAYLPLGLK